MDRWFSGGWLSGGWLAGGSQERKEEDRPSLDETVSSELFAEGKGDEEKGGLKDNDIDCAKGPACLKEEENSERIHYVQGPDVDGGLEENASDGKFIERLKVIADNQNKEWESTSPREGDWVNKYPQRSNEPDCIYYGHGANCKFNHHSYIDEQARPMNTLGSEKAAGETIKEVPERVRQKNFKDAGETIKEVPERVRQKEFKAAGETIKKVPERVRQRVRQKEFKAACETIKEVPERMRQEEFKAAGETVKEVQERVRQKEFKLHTVAGGYKSGSTFKHGHGLDYEKNGTKLELNFSGLPLRPGMSECPYYMLTGSCQYSINCGFHHPNPTIAGENFLSVNGNGGSPQLASGASQMQAPINLSHSSESTHHPLASTLTLKVDVPHQQHTECQFFMRYGDCKFGSSCKTTNLNKSTTVAGSPSIQQTQMEEYPERPGEPECAYFKNQGDHKFKSACKFHHPSASIMNGPKPKAYTQQPKPKAYTQQPQMHECHERPSECMFHHPSSSTSSSPMMMADDLMYQQAPMGEYPQRPGEPECPYFKKDGSCKFGAACKYYHPSSSTSSGSNVTKSEVENKPDLKKPGKYHRSQSSRGKKGDQAPMGEYPQRPGEPECSNFMKHGSCKFRNACKFHHPSASTLSNPTRQKNGQIQPLEQMEQYPERPGEPECTLFMKFGSCRFKSACKYHHPKFHIPTGSPCVIRRNGLPLRPDKPVCFYYKRSGICKSGPYCNFDHPVAEAAMNSSQVSSLGECGTGLGNAAGSNIEGQESEW